MVKRAFVDLHNQIDWSHRLLFLNTWRKKLLELFNEQFNENGGINDCGIFVYRAVCYKKFVKVNLYQNNF